MEGNYIIGEEFNLITSLRENKGGRHVMDMFQEDFKEFLALGSLVDLEMGDRWFTLKNKRGGDHLSAS